MKNKDEKELKEYLEELCIERARMWRKSTQEMNEQQTMKKPTEKELEEFKKEVYNRLTQKLRDSSQDAEKLMKNYEPYFKEFLEANWSVEEMVITMEHRFILLDTMINKALKIATKAHDGQTDKGGQPYIFHPIRVALNCETEEEKIVALLHDVVEDTSVTLEDLKAEGFDDDIIKAVKCLTKRKGDDYEDYIVRVGRNLIARHVKIKDLEDNLDVSRLGGKPHGKLKVYQEALRYLNASVRLSEF